MHERVIQRSIERQKKEHREMEEEKRETENVGRITDRIKHYNRDRVSQFVHESVSLRISRVRTHSSL